MSEQEQPLIHVGKNGPAECHARERACRYGDHFDNWRDAERSFERKMESEGFAVNVSVTRSGKRTYERVERSELRDPSLGAPTADDEKLAWDLEVIRSFRERISAKKPEDYKLDELIDLGREINEEITRHRRSLGITINNETIAHVGRLNSDFLTSLGGEHELENEFHGPVAAVMKRDLKTLPVSALSFVRGEIHTSTDLGANDRAHVGGWHRHGKERITDKSFAVDLEELPEGFEEGKTYLIKSLGAGQTLHYRVDKVKSAEIEPGDSVLLIAIMAKSAQPDGESPMPKVMALRGSGALDENYEVLAGHEQEVLEVFPDFNKWKGHKAEVTKFVLGARPTGDDLSFARYVPYEGAFVSDGATHYNTAWELKGAEWAEEGHTISVRETDGYGSFARNTNIHEFTHALQSDYPGGFPGETQLYDRLNALESEREDSGRGWSYSKAFPDEYMAHENKRELATRATECIITPEDNAALYARRENGMLVRSWILGAWAALAVHGRNELQRRKTLAE